jgi:AcrR family transcriptional regulator
VKHKITKGQQTKIRIIESAMDLFAQNGFARTSIQNIADACGLSQSAVLQHFGTKENLLNEMRLSVSQSNHSWVDGQIKVTDDALTALTKHMFENINWAYHHRRQAQIIVLNYYFGCYDPNYLAINKNVVQVGTERILKYILAGQREGLFHSTGSTEQVAEMLHEYLLGAFVRSISSHWDKDPPTGTLARIQQLLTDVLKVTPETEFRKNV